MAPGICEQIFFLLSILLEFRLRPIAKMDGLYQVIYDLVGTIPNKKKNKGFICMIYKHAL